MARRGGDSPAAQHFQRIATDIKSRLSSGDQAVDDSIRSLVTAINAFPSLCTQASCGGHIQPHTGQLPAGDFYVSFTVAQDREGAGDLNWLTLAIHGYREQGRHVALKLDSNPQHGLYYQIVGQHESAEKLANYLNWARAMLVSLQEGDTSGIYCKYCHTAIYPTIAIFQGSVCPECID